MHILEICYTIPSRWGDKMIKTPTRYLSMDPKLPNLSHLQQAAEILRKGGLVAFPTETVYGLGADALNPEAVEKIFIAKGRPNDTPLIVHVANPKDIKPLVRKIPDVATTLMELFWPGPLTLIFPKSDLVPNSVSAGLDTVGIRIPAHPVALALLKAARIPIAAPSANLSGRPSPTSATHVLKDLNGKIDAIIDGGKTSVGLESTVLDITGQVPTILRPGGVTYEQLEEVLGHVEMDPALIQPELNAALKPRAPGMKYTHYAPRAEIWIVVGTEEQVAKKLKSLVDENRAAGKRVGIMSTEEMLFFSREYNPNPDHWEILGSKDDLTGIATRLFQALRNCDRYHLDIVFTQTLPETGIGVAIMNRLHKAAGGKIIRAN